MSAVVFWIAAPLTLVAGFLVFSTDSMLRAAYFLLASFVAVAVLLLTLASEYLALITVMMMAGEMLIMAVFMVMFMMNPAGLNPMAMHHQRRLSLGASIGLFALLAAGILTSDFPQRSERPPREGVTEALGEYLMNDAMLIFETAGVALLATMIGAIALARHRGRFGVAAQHDPAYTPESHHH